MRCLHYRTTYLQLSETFIDRMVRHHVRYEPVVATVNAQHYTDGLALYAPRTEIGRRLNRGATLLNIAPPVLRRAARETEPDVVHAHFGHDGHRALGVHRPGRPLVVSFYGHDVTRLPLQAAWRRRYQRLAREASRFTTVSALMKRQLVALGFPEARIDVVRSAVDMQHFPHRARHAAGPRLLLVGRLVEKKGVPYALDAVARLRAAGQPVVLRILGDGPLRESIESRAAVLALGDAVIFEGAVSQARVQEALLTHDVLLVPSVTAADGDQEGLPNTVVEGLAAGIPTVATVHAGIPEIIHDGQTGLLVPERDAEALAGAIGRLLGDDALAARLSAEGRQFVLAEHSTDRMIARIEAVYDAARGV